MSELEKELGNIERIYVDPNFSMMVQTVRKLNDLLAEEPVSDEKAHELSDRVNELWRENGFSGESFYVTGYMDAGGTYAPVCYEPLDSVTQFRNKRVVSKGFFVHVAMNDPFLETSDEPLVKRSILMKATTLIEDDSGVEGMSEVGCAIDFRSAEVVYREMTPSRAAAWLEEYHPDTKSELDSVLLNADSETEAVMALRDFTIDVSGLKNKRIYKIVQHLCHWMLGEVQFDRHYPYLAAVDGQIDIFNPVTLQRETTQVNDFLSIHARELSISHDEERNLLQFGVTSEIIDGPLDVARPVQIPLHMIHDIVSTRP